MHTGFMYEVINETSIVNEEALKNNNTDIKSAEFNYNGMRRELKLHDSVMDNKN